jgi:hypothetical protein
MMACLCIAGAMRTNPTVATEAPLGLPHCICSLKQRPKHKFTDCIAVIDVHPNPNVLEMNARHRNGNKTPSYEWGVIR